jgi:hypothetical protein
MWKPKDTTWDILETITFEIPRIMASSLYSG